MRKQEERTWFWQGLAAKLFVLLVALVGVWALFRYALGLVLPFLIAWVVGLVIHPLAVKVSDRWHLPRKLCAAVLMLLTLSLVTLLLILAADRLLAEIRHLLSWLESDGERLGERLAAWIERMRGITSRIPWLDRLRNVEGLESVLGNIDELVNDLIRTTLGELSARIPVWVGAAVRAVPTAMIFLVVTLVACFYFSLDLEAIHHGMLAHLPRSVTLRLPTWRRRAGEIVRQYLRAYLLILVITFLELYTALCILGVDYAFLIAFLTALIDILPVFGVGVVLIPWAVTLLIGKQFFVGFGLLITYAIIMVVRQIIEPRVVSGSLGLHPLLTLFSMYVGYRLFGIFGMMLAPVAVIVIAGRAPGDQSSVANRGVDK